jgi:hypothetical protein
MLSRNNIEIKNNPQDVPEQVIQLTMLIYVVPEQYRNKQ